MSKSIPKIFSFEFHFKFFPRFLWSRLRPRKEEEQGVRFSSNMEFILLLFLCLAFIAMGVSLIVRGSWIGWILGILGICGILTMVIFSIIAQLGTKPSFDNFLIYIFFFFIFLGINAGMFIGKTQHSLFLGLISGALGIILGYIVGIFSALWLQYLGWFASIANILCGLAIFFGAVVDLVLLLR